MANLTVASRTIFDDIFKVVATITNERVSDPEEMNGGVGWEGREACIECLEEEIVEEVLEGHGASGVDLACLVQIGGVTRCEACKMQYRPCRPISDAARHAACELRKWGWILEAANDCRKETLSIAEEDRIQAVGMQYAVEAGQLEAIRELVYRRARVQVKECVEAFRTAVGP